MFNNLKLSFGCNRFGQFFSRPICIFPVRHNIFGMWALSVRGGELQRAIPRANWMFVWIIDHWLCSLFTFLALRPKFSFAFDRFTFICCVLLILLMFCWIVWNSRCLSWTVWKASGDNGCLVSEPSWAAQGVGIRSSEWSHRGSRRSRKWTSGC